MTPDTKATAGPDLRHRCSDADCPYLGQASVQSCRCHLGPMQMLSAAHDSSQALIAELCEALTKIACFDDTTAERHLAQFGNYNAFDEPASARIARSILTKAKAGAQ
jgi:Leu/Phe-tRNA-protein transferase